MREPSFVMSISLASHEIINFDFSITDLSTVGYDIMSVTPMRMMSTPLGLPQTYNSNTPASSSNTFNKDLKIPAFNPVTTTGNGMEVTLSPAAVINPLDGKAVQILSTHQPTIRQDIQSDPRTQTTAANRHLSRIIIAERELEQRLEREAANKYSVRASLRYLPYSRVGLMTLFDVT